MHPETTSPPNYLQKYSAAKKIQFLKVLKRLAFSGQLIWSDSYGRQWTLFLNLGYIVFGTGGIHSIRRWQRHLLHWCPHLRLDAKMLNDELSGSGSMVLPNCWEYQLLYTWMKHQKITEQHAAQIIRDIVVEILFDVVQAVDLTYQFQRCQPLNEELVPIRFEEEEAFVTVQKQWQVWLEADLEKYSPNLAPVIEELEQLRASTSSHTYHTLTVLLNGQQSLRDIAATTRRDTLQLTQALQPYIELGWVKLIDIPDYSVPVAPSTPQRSSTSSLDSPLIACIDDSLTVCQSMERVIKAAGYRFVGIMEAPRAIGTLLTRKPDVIFLDLIMPETNGYEICSQLRKVSVFKDTPIIILSGNDGIVDQVRARLLGASDFVSKPVEPKVILSIIRKHLEQVASN